jgi:hypothetical protein
MFYCSALWQFICVVAYNAEYFSSHVVTYNANHFSAL